MAIQATTYFAVFGENCLPTNFPPDQKQLLYLGIQHEYAEYCVVSPFQSIPFAIHQVGTKMQLVHWLVYQLVYSAVRLNLYSQLSHHIKQMIGRYTKFLCYVRNFCIFVWRFFAQTTGRYLCCNNRIMIYGSCRDQSGIRHIRISPVLHSLGFV